MSSVKFSLLGKFQDYSGLFYRGYLIIFKVWHTINRYLKVSFKDAFRV